MKALLLAIALATSACASTDWNNVNWSAVSQQQNQMLYGNPNGYQYATQPQQQPRVDLNCVQQKRAEHNNLQLAHAQCSY